MIDKMTITLNADVLKALLIAAAKNDVRYYLNGLCFDFSGTAPVIVATDGHRLVVKRLDNDDCEGDLQRWKTYREVGRAGQFIVNRDVLESVKPMKVGRSALPLQVTFSKEPDVMRDGVNTVGMITVEVKGMTTATTRLIDGTYPDWRRVLPTVQDPLPTQYNGHYLADFDKIYALLIGKSKASAHVYHNGNNAAYVDLGDHALGVIMPLRSDKETTYWVPGWVSDKPVAESVAA